MRSSMLKSIATFGGMTGISRVLGFVRDIILAASFGASHEYDAFILAFKIPNFFRRLFAEGAFSQAFVPVLSEYRVKKNKDEQVQFIQIMASNLSVILALVCVIGVLLAPLIILLFAPGFMHSPDHYLVASNLLRITFPYLLLISLVAFLGAVLNVHDRFAAQSFTPIWLNVALIFAALIISPRLTTPIFGIAIGVILGGVIQLLFIAYFIKKLDIKFKFNINFKHPGVVQVLKLMLPALLGVAVVQINMMVDTVFASFLPEGSLTWLYYSERLLEFPVGVFGVALATVVLPKFSRLIAAQNEAAFQSILDWALRLACLITIPASVGLFVLAGPILASLFQHGAFLAHDVMQARLSLMAYSFGLIGFIMIKVVASAFYAKKDMKTPVKMAIISMLVNIILNALLVKTYAHAGLAFATAVSAFVNAFGLLICFKKKYTFTGHSGWFAFITRVTLGTLGMWLILTWMTPPIKAWVTKQEFWRIQTLVITIFISILSYFTLLWVSGIRQKHIRV